jgi:hypothetical protein
VPRGPITSRNSCGRVRASHCVPRPWSSNANSSVPAQPPRRADWWIEKCRRRKNSRPSGIATARNWPGRARSAMSGATSVIEW